MPTNFWDIITKIMESRIVLIVWKEKEEPEKATPRSLKGNRRQEIIELKKAAKNLFK